ncbi:MAG: chemotaxis protein CheZ, partial [Tistlia sp.]
MSVHPGNGAHDLEVRVTQLLKARSEIEPRQLVEAVEAIMATAQGDLSSANLKLYAEIESLAHYIQNARAEIASLRPDEITDEHLPAAGEELEAIVGATEQATNSIMEAVEAIETVAAELPPEQAERITAAVTSVYEACGFQDITGQRISKVVNALRHIESKV